MAGYNLNGVIERVSDGDTLRVVASDVLFKVRVLGLDTEESNDYGSKPVTPWGRAASEYAKALLPVGTPVALEFQGAEPALAMNDAGEPEININYLDNFERPLAHVHMPTPIDSITDFSEWMIRKGFSPYFVKYGRAVFPDHNARYAAAERSAQVDHIGVWNQFLVNGAIRPEDAPRNYARLMVWWELRARIIDEFRVARANAADGSLLNTRLDYASLLTKAKSGDQVTVFMELTEGEIVGGRHYVIRSGSRAQRFDLFLPEADRPEIEAVINLLRSRYVADGEDFPRRNYAYITGGLGLYRNTPQLVVERVDQISDTAPVT